MQRGEVAGITKQREGQIGPSELVGTTQQAVVQSSHVTEEWFSIHSAVKKEVMAGLIDTAKVSIKVSTSFSGIGGSSDVNNLLISSTKVSIFFIP